jgi:hypothetical protein
LLRLRPKVPASTAGQRLTLESRAVAMTNVMTLRGITRVRSTPGSVLIPSETRISLACGKLCVDRTARRTCSMRANAAMGRTLARTGLNASTQLLIVPNSFTNA